MGGIGWEFSRFSITLYLIDKFKNAMDDPNNKITMAKFLDPEVRTPLLKEESLFPFLLNISSFSCHLEELHTSF